MPSLDINANTRAAQANIKDLSGALDDVADALDDVARDGKDAGDKLERSFRDMARAASDAGDDVGTKLDKGFDKARQGADDFKQEANQSMRETAASVSSVEDGLDAVQEIAANAFAGFGPAGAVAGLVAATGIGLAISAMEDANEETELGKERVAEWAGAYAEAGGKILSAGVLAARFQAIITDPAKFAEAETNARNWGVSVETAISAMSGNTGAIDDVKRSVGDLADAYETARQKSPAVDAFGNVNGPLLEQEQAYRTAAGSLNKLTGEMDAGAARARMLSDALKGQINDAREATKEVDGLGNAVYTLPDGTQIMIDAETGQATQDVSKFKGDLDGVPETVTSRVKVAVDSSAWDNWRPAIKHGDVYSRPGSNVKWQ
jgi:ElaB/YqjD/DUF883 family membrane-anchored ribosome-binding protein